MTDHDSGDPSGDPGEFNLDNILREFGNALKRNEPADQPFLPPREHGFDRFRRMDVDQVVGSVQRDMTWLQTAPPAMRDLYHTMQQSVGDFVRELKRLPDEAAPLRGDETLVLCGLLFAASINMAAFAEQNALHTVQRTVMPCVNSLGQALAEMEKAVKVSNGLVAGFAGHQEAVVTGFLQTHQEVQAKMEEVLRALDVLKPGPLAAVAAVGQQTETVTTDTAG